MNAFLALVRKDLVLHLANRRAVLISFVAPILIAAFFGAVLGGPPKKPARIPVAVTDLDASAVSKALVAAMRTDASFDVQEVTEPEAIENVRAGKVRVAAVIPKGFGEAAPAALFRRDLERPGIVVHFDPSQAFTLALIKGLLTQHAMKVVSEAAFRGTSSAKALADAKRDVLASTQMVPAQRTALLGLFDSVEKLQVADAAAGPGTGTAPGLSLPFAMDEREVTSGADRKYNSYAHSFAGMGVQFILFMGIELGVGLLLMRRQGLWKRLRAAPVSRGLLLGSRIAAGTLISAALLAGIYAAAVAFFGVRIEGSFAGFVAIGLAFALLTSCFGLLIAALGRTPEATRGLAVLATLLLVMLGGAWVPTFVFPEWLQSITLVVPTRWAVDGLEAMTWRGLGFDAALAPVGAMLAFSAVFAALAIRRFDWEE
jgi:ABC-2 type transport system permease protein